MARYILTVATNPVPGREDDYNRWYDEVHLAEVLAIDGFVSAERFVVDPAGQLGAPAPRYLAIYGIESDDIDGTMAAFRRFSAALAPHPALEAATVDIQLYQAVTPPTRTI